MIYERFSVISFPCSIKGDNYEEGIALETCDKQGMTVADAIYNARQRGWSISNKRNICPSCKRKA